MFPDEATAERWFASMRWPHGPVCPHCRSSNVQSACAHPSMPYRSRGCRKRFSVRTDSVMADTKLGYRTWALAIYLLSTRIKGISSMNLSRELGITQESAWHPAQLDPQTARALSRAGATGRYHVRSHQCPVGSGIGGLLVNPRGARHFAKSSGPEAKNDPVVPPCWRSTGEPAETAHLAAAQRLADRPAQRGRCPAVRAPERRRDRRGSRRRVRQGCAALRGRQACPDRFLPGAPATRRDHPGGAQLRLPQRRLPVRLRARTRDRHRAPGRGRNWRCAVRLRQRLERGSSAYSRRLLYLAATAGIRRIPQYRVLYERLNP